MQAICDVCGRPGDDNDTVNLRIVNHSGEWEMDMCQSCREKFESDFGQFARDVPRSERLVHPNRKPKQKNDGPYLPEGAMQAYGDRPRTIPCDVKGCDYMGVDNRAVGVHKAKVHGIKGATKK